MHKSAQSNQTQDTHSQDAPVVQKKAEGVKSPYTTKQGKQGPIQSKQGKMPPIQAKQRPIQRNNKPSNGSSGKSSQIASAMGQQYGVDTSGLQMNHNSSFPGKVNAEATIQGNKIDFAPGKDSEKNIKHEVGHYIINTKRGTPPKADTQVNGQAVNTSDEAAADKMMNAPLQMKANNEASQFQTNTQSSSSPVVQNKGNEVVQAKLQIGSKVYDDTSKGYFDATHQAKVHKNEIKAMLDNEGIYTFASWSEFQDYLDGKVHNKGVIAGYTIKLKPKLYIIGEYHNDSPEGPLVYGLKPSNFFYEARLVKGVNGGSKGGKLDHETLQAMFILTEVGHLTQTDKPITGHALKVLKSLQEVAGVNEVYEAVEQKMKASIILSRVTKAYNSLKGKMQEDAELRDDKLNDGNKMWEKMKAHGMHTESDLDSDSDFDASGKKVMDARDYFFANQIQSYSSRPMIALMGDKHVDGTIKYLKAAGVNDIEVCRKLAGDAQKFAEDTGEKLTGDGSVNNIYEDLPDDMKKKKESMSLESLEQKEVDYSTVSLGGPTSTSKRSKKKKKKKKKTKSKTPVSSKPTTTTTTTSDDPFSNFDDNPFDDDFFN